MDSLADAWPELAQLLTPASPSAASSARFEESAIRLELAWVRMRDGVRLATDLYFPPELPAPVIATRTPYGRANERMVGSILAFARRGYVVVVQDCRGTGDSEPDVWDYYIYEPRDGIDCVDWITAQEWFGGALFSFGVSYLGQTQWCMSAHPRMTAIAPEVGLLQTTRCTVRNHMFVNGYPRAVGKGTRRLAVPYTEIERLIEKETIAGGYFNEPLLKSLPEPVLRQYPSLRTLPPHKAKRELWTLYCAAPPEAQAELMRHLFGVEAFSYVEMCSLTTVFDSLITYGAHTIPSPSAAQLCESFRAPALVVTGWYDWNLRDLLPSWAALRRHAHKDVASRSKLIIKPSAHNMSGYHEGEADHPELQHSHFLNVDLLLKWYEAVCMDATGSWPTVTYYLMGANEWRVASDWPVAEAKPISFYLRSGGTLSPSGPPERSVPDSYIYDPTNPTPTLGGNIVSYLYRPGSVDVSKLQGRSDVLTYTTACLESDVDVVGPLRLVLYASSSARDTDFAARLSDVYPDGRAIQLQNGILRARYRNLEGEPELLVPGRVYRFEIDMWSTANRFKAGHRIRLDISSADFPRFDRNSNRGGEDGPPISARQGIYHDSEYPSHLVLPVLDAR